MIINNGYFFAPSRLVYKCFTDEIIQLYFLMNNQRYLTVNCWGCRSGFDRGDRLPRIMPECKHRICQQCVEQAVVYLKCAFYQEVFHYPVQDGELVSLSFLCPYCRLKQLEFFYDGLTTPQTFASSIIEPLAYLFESGALA